MELAAAQSRFCDAAKGELRSVVGKQKVVTEQVITAKTLRGSETLKDVREIMDRCLKRLRENKVDSSEISTSKRPKH